MECMSSASGLSHSMAQWRKRLSIQTSKHQQNIALMLNKSAQDIALASSSPPNNVVTSPPPQSVSPPTLTESPPQSLFNNPDASLESISTQMRKAENAGEIDNTLLWTPTNQHVVGQPLKSEDLKSFRDVGDGCESTGCNPTNSGVVLLSSSSSANPFDDKAITTRANRNNLGTRPPISLSFASVPAAQSPLMAARRTPTRHQRELVARQELEKSFREDDNCRLDSELTRYERIVETVKQQQIHTAQLLGVANTHVYISNEKNSHLLLAITERTKAIENIKAELQRARRNQNHLEQEVAELKQKSVENEETIVILKKAKADVETLVTNYTYGDGRVVSNTAPYFFSEKSLPPVSSDQATSKLILERHALKKNCVEVQLRNTTLESQVEQYSDDFNRSNRECTRLKTALSLSQARGHELESLVDQLRLRNIQLQSGSDQDRSLTIELEAGLEAVKSRNARLEGALKASKNYLNNQQDHIMTSQLVEHEHVEDRLRALEMENTELRSMLANSIGGSKTAKRTMSEHATSVSTLHPRKIHETTNLLSPQNEIQLQSTTLTHMSNAIPSTLPTQPHFDDEPHTSLTCLTSSTHSPVLPPRISNPQPPQSISSTNDSPMRELSLLATQGSSPESTNTDPESNDEDTNVLDDDADNSWDDNETDEQRLDDTVERQPAKAKTLPQNTTVRTPAHTQIPTRSLTLTHAQNKSPPIRESPVSRSRTTSVDFNQENPAPNTTLQGGLESDSEDGVPSHSSGDVFIPLLDESSPDVDIIDLTVESASRVNKNLPMKTVSPSLKVSKKQVDIIPDEFSDNSWDDNSDDDDKVTTIGTAEIAKEERRNVNKARRNVLTTHEPTTNPQPWSKSHNDDNSFDNTMLKKPDSPLHRRSTESTLRRVSVASANIDSTDDSDVSNNLAPMIETTVEPVIPSVIDPVLKRGLISNVDEIITGVETDSDNPWDDDDDVDDLLPNESGGDSVDTHSLIANTPNVTLSDGDVLDIANIAAVNTNKGNDGHENSLSNAKSVVEKGSGGRPLLYHHQQQQQQQQQRVEIDSDPESEVSFSEETPTVNTGTHFNNGGPTRKGQGLRVNISSLDNSWDDENEGTSNDDDDGSRGDNDGNSCGGGGDVHDDDGDDDDGTDHVNENHSAKHGTNSKQHDVGYEPSAISHKASHHQSSTNTASIPTTADITNTANPINTTTPNAATTPATPNTINTTTATTPNTINTTNTNTANPANIANTTTTTNTTNINRCIINKTLAPSAVTVREPHKHKLKDNDNAKTCDYCHKTETEAACELQACAACHLRLYCSVKCQRRDWKSGHKQNCSATAS